MSIHKKEFGITKDGKIATLYTIQNANGMEASVLDFGAILVRLVVPNGNGIKQDLVLGYDHLKDYEKNSCFFGATLGRNANRIGGAFFEIDGVRYQLTANENGNNLHTDFEQGFHKKMWKAEPNEAENSVKFSYESPDMETGFPGTVHISVTYTLLEENGIQITYDGISDKKTILNLTNHSYFNLAGHDAGSIYNEKLTINASSFLEILPGAIPSGRILPVAGTPMDFRTAKRIGDEIDNQWEQLTLVQGYDHNWVLDTKFGELQKIAQVEDEKAGRIMEVYTDLPGVQFYAGNFITPQMGKDGAYYRRRYAFCLETQYFPNSVHIPEFRKPIFDAGQQYHTTTIYKFAPISSR